MKTNQSEEEELSCSDRGVVVLSRHLHHALTGVLAGWEGLLDDLLVGGNGTEFKDACCGTLMGLAARACLHRGLPLGEATIMFAQCIHTLQQLDDAERAERSRAAANPPS